MEVALEVRSSTDNGLTWGNERQLAPASPFIRDVQITGDAATGTVYVAGRTKCGVLTNRANKIVQSTDGGNTWANTFTGATFLAPGRTTCPDIFLRLHVYEHAGWLLAAPGLGPARGPQRHS